jgi:hypothetical protein
MNGYKEKVGLKLKEKTLDAWIKGWRLYKKNELMGFSLHQLIEVEVEGIIQGRVL